MRAITATILLAASVPSAASASELKLLDTRLVLAVRPQPGPLAAREPPTWTAGTTAFSFLTADIALVASVAIGVLGGLAMSEITVDGSAGPEVGLAVAATSAIFLVPGAVMLTASGYDMRPAYGWMLLGNIVGLTAGAYLSLSTESVVPVLVLPAAIVTAIGAATADPVGAAAPRPRFERPPAPAPSPAPRPQPPRAPPPTEEPPEYDDEDDDEYYSAAPEPTRAAHIATVPRPLPRAFVLPVVALRF